MAEIPNIPGMDQAGPSATPAAAPAAAPDGTAPAQLPLPSQEVQSFPQGTTPLPVAGTQPIQQPKAPAVVPAGGHTKLLSMINGLAVGLSAAGTSIATKGKEGGAPQAAQVLGEQQRQREEAQQAAAAQKNAEVQNKIANVALNTLQTQNQMLHSNLKNEMALNDMKVPEAKTTLASEQYKLFAGTGMNADQIDALVKGGPVDAKTSEVIQNNAQRQVRVSSQLLPPDNPALSALTEALKNPNTPAATLVTLSNRVASEQIAQSGVNDEKLKAAEAAASAPLGGKADAINKLLEQRYQVLNPGKALPPEFRVTPQSLPKDYDRIEASLKDTEQAQSTAATRELTNQIHQQTLDLLKGPQGIDPTLSGPAYLDAVAKIDPAQADLLKGYGQGRLILSPNIARTPQGVSLTKQILRAYPNYVAAKAEGYQKLYNEFISGKVGTGINAYKTSLDHLNDMFDNVANASLIDLNSPASKIHQQLDVDKNIISSELAKAVSNGQMTEGEKDQMLASVDGKILGAATKDKYQNQLREVVRLLGGKLGAFQSQWKAGAVEGVDPPSNLTDAAAATQKLASGAAASTVIPAGATGKAYPKGQTSGPQYWHDANGKNLGLVQ